MDEPGIVPNNIRTVTYTVRRQGPLIIITAHLPRGFSMREYTRMFNMRDADQFGEENYILQQQDEMRRGLLTRLPLDQSKLLQS